MKKIIKIDVFTASDVLPSNCKKEKIGLGFVPNEKCEVFPTPYMDAIFEGVEVSENNNGGDDGLSKILVTTYGPTEYDNEYDAKLTDSLDNYNWKELPIIKARLKVTETLETSNALLIPGVYDCEVTMTTYEEHNEQWTNLEFALCGDFTGYKVTVDFLSNATNVGDSGWAYLSKSGIPSGGLIVGPGDDSGGGLPGKTDDPDFPGRP